MCFSDSLNGISWFLNSLYSVNIFMSSFVHLIGINWFIHSLKSINKIMLTFLEHRYDAETEDGHFKQCLINDKNNFQTWNMFINIYLLSSIIVVNTQLTPFPALIYSCNISLHNNSASGSAVALCWSQVQVKEEAWWRGADTATL